MIPHLLQSPAYRPTRPHLTLRIEHHALDLRRYRRTSSDLTPCRLFVGAPAEHLLESGAPGGHLPYGALMTSAERLTVLVVQPPRTSHTLHLLLTVLTGGLWAPLVWLPLSVHHAAQREYLTSSAYRSQQAREGAAAQDRPYWIGLGVCYAFALVLVPLAFWFAITS